MILGANKTPERELLFDYLDQPAFVNESILGVYTATNNSSMDDISAIEELKNYRLATVRGDSYGSEVDSFNLSLSSKQKMELNSKGQTLKMVSAGRLDYFFLPEGKLEQTVAQSTGTYPKLKSSQFKQIFEIHRKIPAFHVFGKNSEGKSKYSERWIKALNKYYDEVNIAVEIQRHSKRSQSN